MQNILFGLEMVALLVAILGIAVFAFIQIRKSLISNGVQIQCSSGDSEVMVFNLNFYEGEDEKSKQAKIRDAFSRIEARREENHQKWLTIKAKAVEENEQAAAQGKDLKLKSVTQEATQH